MKSLPNDVEVERKVLGAMLFDGSAVGGVRDMLSPSDFYHEKHTEIFKAIVAVFGRGDPVDSEILLQELRKRKHLEEVGGASYLALLATEVATAANVEYHAGILLGLSRRRKAITAAQKLERLAGDESKELEGVLREARAGLGELEGGAGGRPGRAFKSVLTVGELLDLEDEETVPLLQRAGDNPLLDLNQVLMLCGNNVVGKTILSIQLGMSLACGKKVFGVWGPEEPIRVVHVHCEMERRKYTKQQVAKMLPTVHGWGRSAMELCRENYTFIGGTEFVDDTQVDLYNPEHQRALAGLVADHGAKLLILDPLYWLVGESDENLAKDMAALTKAVRAVSQMADCAITTTTHYNKAGELPGSYVKAAGVSTIWKLRELEGYERYGRDDIGLYLSKARNGWPMDGKSGWYLHFNRPYLWFEADERVVLPSEVELRATQRRSGEDYTGPGRHRRFDPKVVDEVLKIHGNLGYKELTDLIREDAGCSESTAQRLVMERRQAGRIKEVGGKYELVDASFPYGEVEAEGV